MQHWIMEAAAFFRHHFEESCATVGGTATFICQTYNLHPLTLASAPAEFAWHLLNAAGAAAISALVGYVVRKSLEGKSNKHKHE